MSAWEEPFTDVGNARRLVARHGKTIRYCGAWAAWLVWDGKRWAVDNTGEIERKAKETVRSLLQESAKIEDEDKRNKMAKHALKSEYQSRIHAIERLAQSESKMQISPADLDRGTWLMNCQNGSLDLRTGKLRPHRREDLLTKMAPVDFDPKATCPTFKKFIERIFRGDTELIRYVQQCLGYALTGDVGQKALFVLYGKGNNGKTTLLEAIRHVVGTYGGQIPIEALMMKFNESGASSDIADLRGLRFVVSSEAEQGRRLAEAKVKYLTGMGTVKARFLYKESFEFQPTHKIFLDSNYKPEIRGRDQAIWERIKLIPFQVSIPAAEKDPGLLEKLKGEASGILNWLLQGCLDWQPCEKLAEPEVVRRATSDYCDEMDVFPDFLDECCVREPEGVTTTAELYQTYKDWCSREEEAPIAKKTFGSRLKETDGLKDVKKQGQRAWSGISLRTEEEKAA